MFRFCTQGYPVLDNSDWKLVVPGPFRDKVLGEIHAAPSAEHL